MNYSLRIIGIKGLLEISERQTGLDDLMNFEIGTCGLLLKEERKEDKAFSFKVELFGIVGEIKFIWAAKCDIEILLYDSVF